VFYMSSCCSTGRFFVVKCEMLQLAICAMVSFDYNYQNLLMLIRTIVVKAPLGLRNLNDREKMK